VAEEARKRAHFPRHFGKGKSKSLLEASQSSGESRRVHDADGRRTMNRISIVGEKNTRRLRAPLPRSPLPSTTRHYPVVPSCHPRIRVGDTRDKKIATSYAIGTLFLYSFPFSVKALTLVGLDQTEMLETREDGTCSSTRARANFRSDACAR